MNCDLVKLIDCAGRRLPLVQGLSFQCTMRFAHLRALIYYKQGKDIDQFPASLKVDGLHSLHKYVDLRSQDYQQRFSVFRQQLQSLKTIELKLILSRSLGKG